MRKEIKVNLLKRNAFSRGGAKTRRVKVISRESCPDEISGGLFGFQWINWDIYSSGF